MKMFEASSPQTVNAINAIMLHSVEQNQFSVAVPADNSPTAQVIKATASVWKAYVVGEFQFQSDKYNVFTLIQDSMRFHSLVLQWRKERNSLSSSAWDNILNPSYLRIILMKETAIPFILDELRRELKTGEPDDWFIALWAITEENPVPIESRGNVKEMAMAWLEWGYRRGYIDGEGVGVKISSLGRLGMP